MARRLSDAQRRHLARLLDVPEAELDQRIEEDNEARRESIAQAEEQGS